MLCYVVVATSIAQNRCPANRVFVAVVGKWIIVASPVLVFRVSATIAHETAIAVSSARNRVVPSSVTISLAPDGAQDVPNQPQAEQKWLFLPRNRRRPAAKQMGWATSRFLQHPANRIRHAKC